MKKAKYERAKSATVSLIVAAAVSAAAVAAAIAAAAVTAAAEAVVLFTVASVLTPPFSLLALC